MATEESTGYTTKIYNSVYDFAKTNHELLRNDHDSNIGVGGFTGMGKTTFIVALLKAYSKISGTYWGFDRMTWSRKELMEWINGKPAKEADPETGLRPNQLPEFSAICPDELFLMFYRRTWYEEGQIEGISTFNTCRDRHLLVAGSVPAFWDLDPAFLKRIRFYVYVPERGIAWIFEQENNPFSRDPWNVNENKKTFRKYKNPYHCQNFVCEIEYEDMTEKEKEQYLEIRRTKRIKAIQEQKVVKDRYKDIRGQRDVVIKGWFGDRKGLAQALRGACKDCGKKLKVWRRPLTYNIMADIIGISESAIKFIISGRPPLN